MHVKSIKDFRSFYKEKIKQIQGDNRDEHFVGHSTEQSGEKIFGFFELFHGDKEDINKFIKPFLDLAPDSQAVYEFLQNAYDAEAQIFAFLFNEDYLFVFNNGKKFSFEGIRSILNIGQSTKESKSNVGKFGIGFKIVHRLLGESDGQKELNNYSGPVVFSWNKLDDLKELASFHDNLNVSISTPNFTKSDPGKEYIETDNNPWLFKILLTNFPLGYQEEFRDLEYKMRERIFSEEELIQLSRLTNTYIFESNKFDNSKLEEGTIVFLKLGPKKTKSILNDIATSTILSSLNFLNASQTGHKILEKIYLHSLDIVQSTSKYNTKVFQITSVEAEYETVLADANEADKPELIELMLQYSTDVKDVSLKSEPNLYLYFPMNEEHLQLNFVVHCNVFHNQSSRTGLDSDSPRNRKILRIFCEKLVNYLETLKSNDKQEYNKIFCAIIQSDKVESENKKWAVDLLYTPLLSYCKSNIPSSNGFYFSKDKIRVKITKLNINPSDFGVTSFEWFFFEDLELVSQARDLKKLGVSNAGLSDLLSVTDDITQVNDWLLNHKEQLQVFCDELNDKQINKFDSNRSTTSLFRNLSNIKFLLFSDGHLYSVVDIQTNQKLLPLTEKYIHVNEVFKKLGYLTCIIDTSKIRNIHSFLGDLFPHLKDTNEFLNTLTSRINGATESLTQAEVRILLEYFNNISAPIFTKLVLSEENGLYKVKAKTNNCLQIFISDKLPFLKNLVKDKHLNKYVPLIAEFEEFITNKTDLLNGNSLYEAILNEPIEHASLLDVILEADSKDIQKRYLKMVDKYFIQCETTYDQNSYEHKILELAISLGVYNIKEKIIIRMKDGTTIALKNISCHNRVFFNFGEENTTEYELILSRILPEYSGSAEIVEDIVKSFPDLQEKILLSELFKVGVEKPKEEIIGEMGLDLNDPHQLAFLILYLSTNRDSTIDVSKYSFINYLGVKTNFNKKGKYFSNFHSFIDPNYILDESYTEINALLKIDYQKPVFTSASFPVVMKPILENGEYKCFPVKKDLKNDSLAQQDLFQALFEEFSSRADSTEKITFEETTHNVNSTEKIKYLNAVKMDFLGFEPEKTVFPSDYAIEIEILPDWVLSWLNDGDKKQKLRYLEVLGVNMDSSDLVSLRKMLLFGDPHISNDIVAGLRELKKGYLGRSMLYALTRKIDFYSGTSNLECLRMIYQVCEPQENVPCIFINDVDESGKIHYEIKESFKDHKIWHINPDESEDILTNLKPIHQIIKNRNELLCDFRVIPENYSHFLGSHGIEYQITFEIPTENKEYDKDYYKIWKKETAPFFTIYECNSHSRKNITNHYSFGDQRIFAREESTIKIIGETREIFFVPQTERTVEDLLKGIIGEGGFTQEHLDLLAKFKENEPEEIKKLYDKEFDNLVDFSVEDIIKVNNTYFITGENKTFDEKLLELINAQTSPWKGYIYHFTHLENAIKIIKMSKIKSRNSADFLDSAGSSFIQATQNRIKDFARFYFRPKTPTQYYNEHLGKTTKLGDLPQCPVPIFFRFKMEQVLKTHQNICYVSNGNLRHYPTTQFGNTYEFLKQFNFKNLYSNINDCDLYEFLNASQQEFVIEGELDFSLIEDYDIICPDEHSKMSLLALIGDFVVDFNKIKVDSSYYYLENPKVFINTMEDKITIAIPEKVSSGTLLAETKILVKNSSITHYIETDKRVRITSPTNATLKIFYQGLNNQQQWLVFARGEQITGGDSLSTSSTDTKNLIALVLGIDVRFPGYYNTNIRHYTLQQHTELVLHEFEKYFGNLRIVGAMERETFSLFLVLHDIGKAPAHIAGNKEDQYKHSKMLLSEVRSKLPISDSEYSIFLALIKDDPLGKYFQGKYSLDTAKSVILETRDKFSLDLAEYFEKLTIYYQVDAGSYTEDAGGISYLEHVFQYFGGSKVRHSEESRLIFSSKYEMMYIKLKRAIFE
ncbi:MAG: DUF4433 domain-containing protein [Bacteroidetes bacterium]|nr:DUF4433 domain-containing protein [Bacteroidota bacterium]